MQRSSHSSFLLCLNTQSPSIAGSSMAAASLYALTTVMAALQSPLALTRFCMGPMAELKANPLNQLRQLYGAITKSLYAHNNLWLFSTSQQHLFALFLKTAFISSTVMSTIESLVQVLPRVLRLCTRHRTPT